MTHAELKTKLLAISPIIDGMSSQDGVLLMLTVIGGIAATSGDPEEAWRYTAKIVAERLFLVGLVDNHDDCAGTA